MMITVLKTCCSIIALFLLTSHAHAQVYKWVDEQGQTHFSQIPPPTGEIEVIKTPPPAEVDIEKTQQQIDHLIQQQADDDKIKQQQKEEQQKQAEEAEIKAQNCQTAKRNLQAYQDNPSRRVTDEEGNVTRLTEEQRQQKIKELKQAVSEFCS